MVTKTAQLAAMLEARIGAGALAPGDVLPSEAQLAAASGFSRGTVRAAIGELAGRGLVESARGARSRVPVRVLLDVHVTRPASRVAGTQQATPGADSWVHDVTALGHAASTVLTVASGTGPGGEPVVVRELLRSVDGRPHNLAVWLFPRELAGGTALELPEPIEVGAVPYLGEIGRPPAAFGVTLETRMPDADEAGRLAVPSGVPVMVEHREGATWDLEPVFWSETIWPGDRTRLILEV